MFGILIPFLKFKEGIADAALADLPTMICLAGFRFGTAGGLPAGTGPENAASKLVNVTSCSVNESEFLEFRTPCGAGGGDTAGGGESGRLDAKRTEDRRDEETDRSTEDTEVLRP